MTEDALRWTERRPSIWKLAYRYLGIQDDEGLKRRLASGANGIEPQALADRGTGHWIPTGPAQQILRGGRWKEHLGDTHYENGRALPAVSRSDRVSFCRAVVVPLCGVITVPRSGARRARRAIHEGRAAGEEAEEGWQKGRRAEGRERVDCSWGCCAAHRGGLFFFLGPSR